MKIPSFSLEPLPPETKLSDVRAVLATWFGAGLVRPAPGTVGTFAGLPFGYLVMCQFGHLGLAIAALALLVIATPAATWYGKRSGTVDDQSIVVDEVVGVWIAAIFAQNTLFHWLLAALLFRLFDIWKPWPASFFDNNSKSGFYVMMDDVVAGIYAMLGVAIVVAGL